MRPILLFIALLLATLCQAQQSRTNYWALKWVASSFATPTLPHFRFAVEKRWNYTGINAQAGISMPGLEVTNENTRTKTGCTARLEWRQYSIKTKKERISIYSGAEVFYYYSKGDAIDEFRPPNHDTTFDPSTAKYYKDEYRYVRNVYGATYKFGFQLRINTHFLLELSTGLGFKIMDNKAYNRDNVYDEIKPNPDFFRIRPYETTTLFSPAIPCLFAIGYYF